MRSKELILQRIPSLSEKAVGKRHFQRTKSETRLESQRSPGGQILFTFPPLDQDVHTLEIPSLEYLARLARRETILARRKEKPASVAKGQDHEKAAVLASNAFQVVTEFGKGWLPYESNHSLVTNGPEDIKQTRLNKIKKIYVIQHGVLRNASEYYEKFIRALGVDYDPETTLIIAPQFLAPVDTKPSKQKTSLESILAEEATYPFLKENEKLLEWRYNDWRGAEPAQNKNNPIDSFTAMDQLLRNVLEHTPNAESLEFRGNSEGAQFLDRYLSYSKELKRIEKETNIIINGVITNAGTQHYFDSLRPIFDDQGNIIDWYDYGFESDENLWPLGIFDPPPYILESLDEDYGIYDYPPLIAALNNYLRRTTIGIGTADRHKKASQLPTGKGYRAQGETRLLRFDGKYEHLKRVIDKYRRQGIDLPDIRTFLAKDFDHDAGPMLAAAEAVRYAQQLMATNGTTNA